MNYKEINKYPLFTDKKINYIVSNHECEKCKKELCNTDMCFIFVGFSSKNCIQTLLCIDCIKKFQNSLTKFYNLFSQIVPCYISEFKKDSWIPFIFSKPVLSNCSDYDVYTAVNLKSVKTIDKTKFAGRESLEGANVGVWSELDMEKDSKVLDDNSFMSELLELKNAKPFDDSLEYKDKKLLGNKKNGTRL